MSGTALETLLRRDRLVVGLALAVLVAAAWLYLLYLDREMPDMPMSSAAMPGMNSMHEWSWVDVGTLVVMWAVMMIAMMVPSAAPMILTFTAVHRRRAAEGRPAIPAAMFVLAYVFVWTAFAILAALAQLELHAAALLSSAMAAESRWLAGGLLVLAGVFQWTPLKHACLSACRSPLSFVMRHWREGRGGAFVMGVRHALYCLGCCWAFMGLLFVVGVMNVLWVALIGVAVLVEKIVPRGDLVGRVAGVLLIVVGVWLASAAVTSP